MAIVCYGIIDCNKALVRYRYRENPKRDFSTVQEEVDHIIMGVAEKKPPCWANLDPSKPDFPDPPHWTTKLARCTRRKLRWRQRQQ